MQVYMLFCGVHTLSLNCPFLSKYLMDIHVYHSHWFIVDIYVHEMAIRGGTAGIDFSHICFLDNIQKISYGKFQLDASIYAVMWRPYFVSEVSISFKVCGGCTFISCSLVSDIYVHRMAIRGDMTVYSITL